MIQLVFKNQKDLDKEISKIFNNLLCQNHYIAIIILE